MSDKPILKPYVPFPTFADWQKYKPSFASYDALAATFEGLKSDAGATALAKAVDVATKWAAIDTGAIEGLYEVERGFTFTMALNAAAWDNMHQVKDASVVRTISDAMEAYEYVLDIATNRRPITEVWIRELHATICASQATYTVYTDVGPQERALAKGAYKTDPNSPLNLDSNEVHSYAPPEETSAEMARLVDELRSDEFAKAHPILQASYAHYAFVCVHPFPDGNGRVSRALSSVYLYRDPGIPLVVFADQKPSYLDALEASDNGKFELFIRFVSERTIDAMGMVRTVLETVARPAIKDQVAAARALLVGRGGLSHQEFDAIGIRYLEVFAAALEKVTAESGIGPPLSASVQRSGGGAVKAPEGYRAVPSNPLIVTLGVQSSKPMAAAQSRTYKLAIARPDTSGADFLIMSSAGLSIEAELREMSPTVSAPLQFRLETVAEGEVGELLSAVVAKAEEKLKSQGYSL